MQQAILDYINKELLPDKADVEVDASDELLVAGHIDSLGLVRLLAFVEDTFALRVPPRDVTIENFGSVTLIVAYLEQSGLPAGQG